MKLFAQSLPISWLDFSFLSALLGKIFLFFIFSFSFIDLSNNLTSIHLNQSVLKETSLVGFLTAGFKPKKEIAAGFIFECEDCKNQGLESTEKIPQKVFNIKTCDIVSHKRKLKEGSLSDYWAQELIGSDLLREELEKIPAPNIENWIGIFDTELGNHDDHNIGVKNLISDKAMHAVLPELKERKIPFLDTNSNPQGNSLSRSEYKEGKGYQPALSFYEISYPGDYLFGFKERAPRYINNSMGWRESEVIYEIFKKAFLF